MGGILIRPRIPKIFRLRRAKNRVFGVFGAKKNPPALGQKSCVCFWSQKFSACGGHTTKLVSKEFYELRNALLLFAKRSSSHPDIVPGVFTSVGTRFYYSQNDLDSGSGADAGPGVSTSVGTRFYYSQNDLTATQTQFLAFSGV